MSLVQDTEGASFCLDPRSDLIMYLLTFSLNIESKYKLLDYGQKIQHNCGADCSVSTDSSLEIWLLKTNRKNDEFKPIGLMLNELAFRTKNSNKDTNIFMLVIC